MCVLFSTPDMPPMQLTWLVALLLLILYTQFQNLRQSLSIMLSAHASALISSTCLLQYLSANLKKPRVLFMLSNKISCRTARRDTLVTTSATGATRTTRVQGRRHSQCRFKVGAIDAAALGPFLK